MRLLLLLLMLNAYSLNARVELQSVYFVGNSTELTEYSSFILERLKTSFVQGEYQIIEINGFCEGKQFDQNEKSVSEKRIGRVFNILESDSSDASMNAYGFQRIDINFAPVNWNRVDIYYSVIKAWKIQEQPKAESELVPTDQVNDSETLHIPVQDSNGVAQFMEIPEYKAIPKGETVALPVFFAGDKAVLLDEGFPILDQLYRTLATYPNLNVHIRGHVCCGKNKQMSSKRAKSVYNYLLDRGISEERLSYKGYSNTIPLVYPERSDEDRAKNRRVDIIYSE